MKKLTDQQLKAELKKRGYCTSALWHIKDVKQMFDDAMEDEGEPPIKLPTDQEWHEILNNLVGINADMQPLNEDLQNIVYEKWFSHLSIGSN